MQLRDLILSWANEKNIYHCSFDGVLERLVMLWKNDPPANNEVLILDVKEDSVKWWVQRTEWLPTFNDTLLTREPITISAADPNLFKMLETELKL